MRIINCIEREVVGCAEQPWKALFCQMRIGPFVTVTKATQIYFEKFTIFNSVIVLISNFALGRISNGESKNYER